MRKNRLTSRRRWRFGPRLLARCRDDGVPEDRHDFVGAEHRAYKHLVRLEFTRENEKNMPSNDSFGGNIPMNQLSTLGTVTGLCSGSSRSFSRYVSFLIKPGPSRSRSHPCGGVPYLVRLAEASLLSRSRSRSRSRGGDPRARLRSSSLRRSRSGETPRFRSGAGAREAVEVFAMVLAVSDRVGATAGAVGGAARRIPKPRSRAAMASVFK
jgi:hypothetical protein